MSKYVLVHGAWHTGAELEATANPIRTAGHECYTPTLVGNRPGDVKTTGLEEAIQSLVDYLVEYDLNDIILVGHSYGGMIITGAADRVMDRIKRLVYWNAFVPNDGECLNDLVPPHYVGMFEAIEKERGDGSVVLPYPVWREAFINDADNETAQKAYDALNSHPGKTNRDPIKLNTNPAEMMIGKSFINCTEDTALPQSMPWHPRMSEKLGLFRLVQISGSHEVCFTNPTLLAQAIMDAGRD